MEDRYESSEHYWKYSTEIRCRWALVAGKWEGETSKCGASVSAPLNHSGRCPLLMSSNEYGESGPCLRMAWGDTDNPVY